MHVVGGWATQHCMYEACFLTYVHALQEHKLPGEAEMEGPEDSNNSTTHTADTVNGMRVATVEHAPVSVCMWV